MGTAALVVTALAAREVYPHFKAWRGRRLAVEIERRLAVSDLAAARPLVRTAIRLAPSEPDVLRVTARFCGKAGSSEALGYWQKYLSVAGPKASIAERREFLDTALTANRLDLVRGPLAEMVRATPGDPALLSLLVRQHLMLGDQKRAVAAARAWVRAAPLDRMAHMRLGAVLVNDPDAGLRAEGRRVLGGLASDGGENSLTAAVLLAEAADITRADAEVALRKLSATNPPPLRAGLALATVRIRIDPSRAPAVIDATLSGLAGITNVSEVALVSEWLLRKDPARLADWPPLLRSSTNRALAPLRAEALAASARWVELAGLLDGASSGLDPALALFFRGRTAAGAGRMPDAATHYRSAVESAEAGERWLVVLARTAESQGLAAVAIEAWLRLIDDPRLAVEAARELSRLAAPLDDLTPMRRAVTRLSEFFNEDDSFAAERATLDLLFGENPARPTGVLERLCGRSDPRPEWRAGLALARLAAGEPQSGLSALEDSGFDFASAVPRSQAIYVACLGASGQREAARRFARRIDSGRLRRQESALVAPWL